MFPMMGYYGMNPFGCWGVCPRPGIGFLLGFAAATAFQPVYSAPKKSSVFTNSSQAQNQTTNQTQSGYNIPQAGNFGSLTASAYGNDTIGLGSFGAYGNVMPYYQPTISMPDVTVVANALADSIVNRINSQMQAVAQAQAQAQAQAAQSQSVASSSTASDNTQVDNIGSISTQGVILKGKGKGTQYGPAFLAKVQKIANNLNCNYRDLIAIFNSEFGVEANKTAKNGAVGLICFMPQYFDTRKIVRMTPLEQLDVVEETIMKSKKQAGFAPNARLSKADLYALVFLPARANREVLCSKGEGNRFYESNSALDYNKDGKITKTEMAHRIDKKYVSDQTFLA